MSLFWRSFGILFLVVSCSDQQVVLDPLTDTYLVPARSLGIGHLRTSERSWEREYQSYLKTYFKKQDLRDFGEITALIQVNHLDDARKLLAARGVKRIYDPAPMDEGSGFLIVEMQPEDLIDRAFLDSLKLMELIPTPPRARLKKRRLVSLFLPESTSDLSASFETVNLSRFRKDFGNRTRGEGITVAVIDSGIDPTHPAFDERVVFWADETKETRTKLTEAKAVSGFVRIAEKMFRVPGEAVTGEKHFVGVIEESRMGYDLNANSVKTDQWPVLVSQSGENLKILIDRDRNGEFNEPPHSDFNDWRKKNLPHKGLLDFSTAKRRLAYPLLTERSSENQNPQALVLGVGSDSHGTHVAGIIAGGGLIPGVAPKAKLMAIKVCTQEDCPDSAIFRGLVRAFDNPSGLKPDVVNISLGSLEQKQKDLMNWLIDDLSRKFGTLFFIAASNSGPAFRTLNAIGTSNSSILVAAARNPVSEGGQGEPDLYWFSSLGPSMQGILKPNFSAPGGTLSSVYEVDGGYSYYRGTSMAAPFAAGVAATMLSASDRWRTILSGSTGSRAFFPHLMRTALESTARTRVENMRLQQGYGLIQVPEAFEFFDGVLASGEFGDYEIPEWKLTTLKGDLYDRERLGKVNPEAKGFRIGLGNQEDTNPILIQSLTLKLVRVEKVSASGSVEAVDLNSPKLPIRIHEGENGGLERQVILAHDRLSQFVSLRQPKLLSEGETAIAYYELWNNKVRLFSFTDVFHKTVGELQLGGVSLEAGKIHRFPFEVPLEASEIDLRLAITGGQMGSLLALWVDPQGEELIVYESFKNIAGERKVLKKNFAVSPGIHELVIWDGSYSNPKATRYDLEVSFRKEAFSRSEIIVSKENPKQVFTYQNAVNNPDVSQIKLRMLDFNRVYSFAPMKVKPRHWSLKRLPCPDFDSVDFTLAFGQGDFDQYSGKISPELYRKIESGGTPRFEAGFQGKAIDTDEVDFEGVPCNPNSEWFVAIETELNYSGDVKKAMTEINLEATFDSLEVDSLEIPTVELMESSDQKPGDPRPSPLVIEVSAPRFSDWPVWPKYFGRALPALRGELEIDFGGMSGSSEAIRIPVTVVSGKKQDF